MTWQETDVEIARIKQRFIYMYNTYEMKALQTEPELVALMNALRARARKVNDIRYDLAKVDYRT